VELLLSLITWLMVDGWCCRSQTRWSDISLEPFLLLHMFLPALIFESSMSCDYFVFSNHAIGAILLAGPGMVLQIVLIAVCVKFILPYSWGWIESLLFGGIISATDPVSVISLVKELGVVPDLGVLIEGESILNDGTAIIAFELCLAMLFTPGTPASFFGKAMQLILGGPALGILFFLVLRFALTRIKDPLEQTLLTVCSAYICYFVAEVTVVRVSGVLAVFMQGFLVAGFGKSLFSSEAQVHAHTQATAASPIHIYTCCLAPR
jgi:NhaP-type Na+/H+ or K+/H+ antiporter